MINLIYRNYSDGETQMLSTSLTYFSMLAIFPVIALILGISKGFGFDRLFIRKIFEIVPQNEGMVRTVLDVANKLLVSRLYCHYIYRAYILYSDYSYKFICNRKSRGTFLRENTCNRIIYKSGRTVILHSAVYITFLSYSKYECKIKTCIYFRNNNGSAMFHLKGSICIPAVIYNKI